MKSEVESRSTITGTEWEKSTRYRVIQPDGNTTVIESERPKTFYRTTMRYTLTNAKSVPVDVELTQSGLYWGWWGNDYRITSEDVVGEQLNSGTRKWVVPVPANGERVVRVTYETRY